MDEFYEQAYKTVEDATEEQIRRWAVEWVASKHRDAARAETLHQERVAQGKRSAARPRWSNDGLGAPKPEMISRKNKTAEDVKALHRILVKIGSGSLPLNENKYVGIESSRHGVAWRALSSDDKRIVIRNYPTHVSIDTNDPEWLEYAASEEGAEAVSRRKEWAEWRAVQQTRKENLAKKAMAQEVMDWTVKLLESEFALPDGRRVRWGSATLDDHKIRFEMLMNNAEANVEAALRHEAAIGDLLDAGVSSLFELGQGGSDE